MIVKVLIISFWIGLFTFFSSSNVFAAIYFSETQPAGNSDKNWRVSAMSGDGEQILVGAYSGRLYLSSNGGDEWTETRPDGNVDQDWVCAGMSTDGQVMIVGTENSPDGLDFGQLYVSTNSGTSWNQVQSILASPHRWRTCAISGDGSAMLAGIDNGELYLSTNFGTTWTENFGDIETTWYTTSINSDGEVMLAGEWDDEILYLSTDGGDSWVDQELGGVGFAPFGSSAISSDGEIILAGQISSGRLYMTANGGGAGNWDEVQPAGNTNQDWRTVSMSDDGQYMLAGAMGGKLYYSSDFGQSWEEASVPGAENKDWYTSSMDTSGGELLAGVNGGRLYLDGSPAPAPTPSGSGGGSSGGSGCSGWLPVGSPSLYQINTTASTATLFYVPILGSTNYVISYGVDPEASQYSVFTNQGNSSGALVYTINHLLPNRTYHFRVRGQNGCLPGEFGNTLGAKTSKVGSQFFYLNNQD